MENWTIYIAVCQNTRSQRKFFDKSVDEGEQAKPKKEKKDKKDKSESLKKPKGKKEKRLRVADK